LKANVSIVIPTWNGVELLKQFFPSVAAAARRYIESTGNLVEIVLVDDGSTDATAAWFHDRQSAADPAEPVARLLVNETNRGFVESVNRGVRESRHPHVLLLNNDVEVAPDVIARLVESITTANAFAAHCRVFEYESRKECGAGQMGSFRRGSIRVHAGYRVIEQPATLQAPPLPSMFASGGSALYDRGRLLALGAFDALFSPGYWEDVEISYRAWKRGWTIVYEPRAVVYHQVSSTMRRLSDRLRWRLQQRNRLMFHWIHLHERRYLLSHLLWVGLLFVTAPLRLQPLYMLAVIDAVRRLPQIRQRRRDEERLARRSDREVFQLFEELRRRSDLIVD
jgi:GT2 family glycosyltransferase